MKVIGKILGFLMILVAIPLLSAVVITVGMTRVALSADFVSDVPREVIKQLPDLVDKTFEAAKKPGALKDKQAQQWVDAMALVKPSPSEMLKQIGVYKWLQTELDSVFKNLGDVLRGKADDKPIILDTRPLKKAFTSPTFRNYVKNVVKQLPACNPQQVQEWNNPAIRHSKDSRLPACNPGEMAIQTVLDRVTKAMQKIPDTKMVLEKTEMGDKFKVVKVAGASMWFLFLIPLFILLLASVMGGTGGKGFMRWFGLSTLLGGVIPLGSSWFLKDIVLEKLKLDPNYWSSFTDAPFWTSQADQIMTEKTVVVINKMLTPLFGSVFFIAAVVSAIGLCFLIFSFFVGSSDGGRKKKKRKRQQQAGGNVQHPKDVDKYFYE